jgi:competence protein ComEC
VPGQPLWGTKEIQIIRHHIENGIRTHVKANESQDILLALLLGDRGGIDTDMREAFIRTGLMHLLALSGLHVLLFGLTIHSLLRPLLSRMKLNWFRAEQIRGGITVVLLGAYVVVTGAPTSVIRASVMATIFVLGPLFGRTGSTLNALGVAALILLSINPSHLFDVGFQLSFAAVIGIVMLNPILKSWLPSAWFTHKASAWILNMVLTSSAATLSTMPALLFHFGRVAWAGLLLNLIAIPLTAGTLGAGLITVMMHGWASTWANIFGASAEGLSLSLLETARFGSENLAWTQMKGYLNEEWDVLALVGLVLMLTQWPHPRRRWVLLAGTLLSLNVGIWSNLIQGTYRPQMDVIFFDVGQGDAVLIGLPNGRHMLIDAGPRTAYTDHGVRTLLPHLARYNIDVVDTIVISHPHSDHLGGLPALLRSIKVRQVVDNGQPYTSTLYKESLRLLDSLNIGHRSVLASDTLNIDPSVRIQVLHPARTPHPHDAPNPASIVLRVVYGKTTFIFTGDAEAWAEAQMLDRYGPLLKSQVIKVGHHGSKTSSTYEFVEQVVSDSETETPYAIISVAEHNPYRLPSKAVVARWRERGAVVMETNKTGAVWLQSNGNFVNQIDWR